MKLSVCIPVYKVSAYIEKCARSLFGQTYEDLEFVFVDDCSPDDSIDIVKRVLKDYPQRADQVRFLRHECNRGLVAARKTAIRAATGAFIAHCDSDDWVDVDLYGKMMARLAETGADAAICSATCYFPSRTIVAHCPDGLLTSGAEAMRRMDGIPGLNSLVTKVFRRECVDLDRIEWPETICIAEDYCHTMQVLPQCRLLVGVPDASYHYRINANSMTRSRDVRRLLDHHAHVYDILTRRVPGDESVVPRRNLVRSIVFWGTVHGLLSAAEFRCWSRTYRELEGRWDWSDKSLWGQRLMKVAARVFPLSRLLSPFVRRKVNDYL